MLMVPFVGFVVFQLVRACQKVFKMHKIKVTSQMCNRLCPCHDLSMCVYTPNENESSLLQSAVVEMSNDYGAINNDRITAESA